MKPFMMKFKQGNGSVVVVNMNQVCHIMIDGASGSVLTFGAVINNEPAYLCVSESPDEIAQRSEWKQ